MTEKSDASMPGDGDDDVRALDLLEAREQAQESGDADVGDDARRRRPDTRACARASSAAVMSIVPAVTTQTVPSTFAIGLPTERCRVPERGS